MDAGGSIGWAPASYLAPANKSDYEEEKEENDQLIEQEKGNLLLLLYLVLPNYQ